VHAVERVMQSVGDHSDLRRLLWRTKHTTHNARTGGMPCAAGSG
jgi:hypothetical protein